jgi:coenzyme F420-reducing hydrogenase alpha subunit
VPGGVSEPLSREMRDRMLASIPEALAISQRTLSWFKTLSNIPEEIRHSGIFQACHGARHSQNQDHNALLDH